MSELDARQRASLPDSAFAYVDSRGRRRLPINDEPHVRNALARFSQTGFEDDEARERARTRLLRAARKYGIVPVGFMTAQLRDGRRRTKPLPEGSVAFFLADIEDSTGLLTRLGDEYRTVLTDVRQVIRRSVARAGGHEVDARADEFFGVFAAVAATPATAIAIHRTLRDRAWPKGVQVRVRIGIHAGGATLTEGAYVGLAVHTAARVCTVGHGGQTLLSGAAREALGVVPAGLTLVDLGRHELHGLPEAVALFSLEAPDLPSSFPPLRTLAPIPGRRASGTDAAPGT